MRNTELIREIYKWLPKMAQQKYTTDQLFDRLMDIQDMIERERPDCVSDWEISPPTREEIAADGRLQDEKFWKGGYLPPKTHAEWMEEMRKYPHRDNHMD